MADDGTQPAKQGMSTTKKVVIGIVVLSVLSALANGGRESSGRSGGGSGSGGGHVANPVAKGGTYVVNDVQVTVTGAAFRGKVEQNYASYAATEGAKLVIVDYSVKNVGKEPVACLSFADDVTDSSGVSYEPTLDCNLAVNNWAMDNLNPGLPKKYQACFEVPSGASGFTMHVNCAGDDGYFALGI